MKLAASVTVPQTFICVPLLRTIPSFTGPETLKASRCFTLTEQLHLSNNYIKVYFRSSPKHLEFEERAGEKAA